MEMIINALLDKGLIPLAIIIAGWVAARYLAPYLASHPNAKKTAVEVAAIADDITHVLVATNPNTKWDDHLASLVDQLIKVLDLKPETAARVAQAALLRKGIAPPDTIALRDLGVKIIDESKADR